MNAHETYEAHKWLMDHYKPPTDTVVDWNNYLANRRVELIQQWFKDNTPFNHDMIVFANPAQFRILKQHAKLHQAELDEYVEEHLMDEVKEGRLTFNPSATAAVVELSKKISSLQKQDT